MEWFNDLQRISASPENAARLKEEFARVDVGPLMACITVPTLGFHCQNDGAVPFEEGKLLAASIPGRSSCRCPAGITWCSSTNRPGRSSCASWESSWVGRQAASSAS